MKILLAAISPQRSRAKKSELDNLLADYVERIARYYPCEPRFFASEPPARLDRQTVHLRSLRRPPRQAARHRYPADPSRHRPRQRMVPRSPQSAPANLPRPHDLAPRTRPRHPRRADIPRLHHPRRPPLPLRPLDGCCFHPLLKDTASAVSHSTGKPAALAAEVRFAFAFSCFYSFVFRSAFIRPIRVIRAEVVACFSDSLQ